METCVMNKRSRETSPETSPESSPEESPESKRLHADLLFDILEEEEEEVYAGERDLATVIKSLEEEISMPFDDNGDGGITEIGYLLEASDDDLGLPPPASPLGLTAEDVEPSDGFGQIWGFEEELPVWPEDGGLFDSPEFFRRPEIFF